MTAIQKSSPIPPSRQRERPGQQLKWIGKSIKRVEDPRLLTGQGRYIDGIDLPNMLHAAVLRSPHAHARILSIDVSAAAALPGVVAVLTGEDIAKATGALPCFANPPVEQRCVAVGRVRHVGEPVAVAVAESRYIAEDAVDLVRVDYASCLPWSIPKRPFTPPAMPSCTPNAGRATLLSSAGSRSAPSSRISGPQPESSGAACAGHGPEASR